MNTIRYIVTFWMTASILTAGFLARSEQFHAWLHEGEDLCHAQESHCHSKGQFGHHHEGEGTEEHPHGLLTLMAGAAMESSFVPCICPEQTFVQWTFITWNSQEIPCVRTWKATLGRAPPIHS
ncbi:MAG: hypothetical protein P8L18_04715 [Verrucomicrobiota bacterium]|nr:hypothetical protein [Verrucomicrobiota bacterium]